MNRWTPQTVLALVTILLAAAAPARAQYEPTWESLARVPVPEWFDDAKFGIFIHWGPYSVIGHRQGGRGYAEHVPKEIYANPGYYYAYLEQRFGGHPPEFGYKEIVEQFRAEKWDPAAWAELFEQAGAKYVILTGEHHDGFALWDSDRTQWCAAKVGPLRDLVGDLGKAVRARGLKFAPSYHRERHTGFFAKEKYAVRSEPRADIAEEIRRHPEAAGLYGPFSYTDDFIADYAARWKELQDKYQPDFMWLDDIPIFYKAAGDPQAAKLLAACKQMITDYLNAAERWGKEVYLNNKGATPNWPVDLGCLEKDNLQLEKIGSKWENPATLASSYGYLQEEEKRDAYQTPEKLIHLLCDVVSKNGNLLLNIGPKGDGTIPAGMQDRLRCMGNWLRVNGQAIYGTRPWKTYGEGITPLEQRRDAQGRHTVNSSGIRFTRAKDGRSVYAILLECPQRTVTIASFRGEPVTAVELLGSHERIDFNQGATGLNVTLPATKPCDYAYVLKVRLK